MARAPGPLPDALPWRVFTAGEALRAGVSRSRLRRTDLVRLRSGLYARAGWGLYEADVASAFSRAEPTAVIVGLTAARILRMPLPYPQETWSPNIPVQISVSGGRVSSDAVVRWRELTLDPSDIRGAACRLAPSPAGIALPSSPIRITSRARTWRDLAPSIPPFSLIAIGDHLVRRPRPGLEGGRTTPWCTIDELRAQCTGRHAETLRRALEQVRVGADSPRETLLRLAFARAGLPEPQINVALRDADGRAVHESDFLWPQYRVCAEYEGKHHSQRVQADRDIDRARRAKKAGWVEVRLHRRDAAFDSAAAIAVVRDELIARGWRPGTRQ